jgi:hypothetical protein
MQLVVSIYLHFPRPRALVPDQWGHAWEVVSPALSPIASILHCDWLCQTNPGKLFIVSSM